MAAVNFGGILPRMRDLSHGNRPGYGIVLVLRLFQGRDLFHSLLLAAAAAVQWSLQGLFMSKIPKLIWNLSGYEYPVLANY
jgi:hypothetical protein